MASDAKHKIANKRLRRILCKRGYKCHWCGRPLVLIRELKRRNVTVLRMTSSKIYWQEGSLVRECFIATVDHVIRLADGGDNKDNNLVASCYRCNQKRNNELQQKRKKKPGQQHVPPPALPRLSFEQLSVGTHVRLSWGHCGKVIGHGLNRHDRRKVIIQICSGKVCSLLDAQVDGRNPVYLERVQDVEASPRAGTCGHEETAAGRQ